MSLETQYRLVGDGVLKRKVPVVIDTDKINLAVVETLKMRLHARLTNLMNEKAKEKGYDNILSACSYSYFPNPFQEESTRFFVWRSKTWETFINYFNSLDKINLELITIEQYLEQHFIEFETM